MPGPPSPLIENYLREASFWHVATIGRRCKLNPKLISALIESYNWDCWWMGLHSPGPFNLLIGEPYVTIF
ncbi:hypothetical protein Goshw_002065 [Gossypium schwendimanii]|uniref:Uncharacterized protein n=1 Tax=Gossypium schwendimanii TaxID=34291 RepID=A0A7J9M069_GOSSC|nr:hypothetical protein [Gossypium schwendimanii]